MTSVAEFDPAPTSEETVLDPAWLTQALSVEYPGVEVRGVTVVERLVHTATKIRIKLDYANQPEGLVDTLCIKALLGENASLFGGGAGARGLPSEPMFYRDCASELPLRVPKTVYIGINDQNLGVFIMEDLIVQGAVFGSALTPYTGDQVRSSLEQLAVLHVAGTKRWTPETLAWAKPFLEVVAERPIIPIEMLHELLNGVRGDPLPVELRDGPRLQAAVVKLRDRFRGKTPTLIHGDAHAGNLYRLNGETGVIDWQVIQWGSWAMDVAYHIGAVLTPEDRRASERELLEGYLTAVRKLGGDAPGIDEAWDDYRAALIYGFYLWGVTRRVAPDVTNEFNRRLGTAVHDHQSFALLGL
jgi:hypothetical protein